MENRRIGALHNWFKFVRAYYNQRAEVSYASYVFTHRREVKDRGADWNFEKDYNEEKRELARERQEKLVKEQRANFGPEVLQRVRGGDRARGRGRGRAAGTPPSRYHSHAWTAGVGRARGAGRFVNGPWQVRYARIPEEYEYWHDH